jgi:hypothetical protein
VADYSEFPTTPTAWQEAQAQDWGPVSPLDTEDAAPQPRRPDLVALVPGVLFVVLAISLMSGLHLPEIVFRDGALFWVVLLGVGLTLVLSELRKARRRR